MLLLGSTAHWVQGLEKVSKKLPFGRRVTCASDISSRPWVGQKVRVRVWQCSQPQQQGPSSPYLRGSSWLQSLLG